MTCSVAMLLVIRPSYQMVTLECVESEHPISSIQ
jgi:hypothetical protein